jgi:hypothetical protein
MSDQSKRSPAKNLLYTVVLLLFLFVMIEVILSVFLYHRYSSQKLATVETVKMVRRIFSKPKSSVNVHNQQLVRPDSSEAVNRQIAEETENSNKFEYASWIEFRNINFDGKYVNVNNSIRRSIPDQYISTGSKDTLNVYFFGGSTMFGFNVADKETIPSQFVELYKQRYPNGPSLHVFNYATPTYYSYQELIQLSNLVFQGHRPDAVIFLDGVNDFWFGKVSYYDQSYFSYVFRQVFAQKQGMSSFAGLKDSADLLFRDPTNIPLQQYNDKLIENYFNSVHHAKMMADMAGAKSYFFCQPVPFYRYPNQQKDPICFKDEHTRYDYIYPRVEKSADSLPNFTFLGNMLEAETGYPFVDGLHYSPVFIKKITAQIMDIVAPGLLSADK